MALFVLLLGFTGGPLFGSERRDLEEQYRKHGTRAAPRDAFPVLTNPEKVPVDEADETLPPNEWVIGVQHNGEAAAYPVSVMGVHELINDTLGGKPITVCW